MVKTITLMILLLLSIISTAMAEDYFAPIKPEQKQVLEKIFNEAGVELSKVTLYKTVSEPEMDDYSLKARLHVRKTTKEDVVWQQADEGDDRFFLNGGLYKVPNIVIDESGDVVSVNFSRINKPIENIQSLARLKKLLVLAFYSRTPCNQKTVDNLPLLPHLKELVLKCKKEVITFPDISKMPDLSYLRIQALKLKEGEISKSNKIKALHIQTKNNSRLIERFGRFTKLEKFSLYVKNNPEDTHLDLGWLNTVNSLKHLTITGQRQVITNFNSLKNLQYLNYLNLHIPQMESIGGFESLKSLETLRLSGMHKLTALPGLSHLSRLKTLSLEAHNISTLPGLGELAQLEDVSLNMHQLKQIPSLKKSSQLKKFYMSETKVDTLEFIKNNIALEELKIFRSPISSMKPLENLVNLTLLSLRETSLRKIEGLGKIKKLNKLVITRAPITRLEGLNGVNVQDELNLTGLKIDKLSMIDKIKNLKVLFVPRFKKTPENYQYLKNLEKKGVRVIF